MAASSVIADHEKIAVVQNQTDEILVDQKAAINDQERILAR